MNPAGMRLRRTTLTPRTRRAISRFLVQGRAKGVPPLICVAAAPESINVERVAGFWSGFDGATRVLQASSSSPHRCASALSGASKMPLSIDQTLWQHPRQVAEAVTS
jgi:hypothetical protein